MTGCFRTTVSGQRCLHHFSHANAADSAQNSGHYIADKHWYQHFRWDPLQQGDSTKEDVIKPSATIVDDDGPDGNSANPSSYAPLVDDEASADAFPAGSFSDEGLQDPWIDAAGEESQSAGAVEVAEEAAGTAGGSGSGLGSGGAMVDIGSVGGLALGSYAL